MVIRYTIVLSSSVVVWWPSTPKIDRVTWAFNKFDMRHIIGTIQFNTIQYKSDLFD